MAYSLYERYVTEVFAKEIEEGKEVIVPLTEETRKERLMVRAMIGAPDVIKKGEAIILKSDAGIDKETDLVVQILEELPDDHPAWGECIEMKLGKKPQASSMI
jgi:hypothetical protein